MIFKAYKIIQYYPYEGGQKETILAGEIEATDRKDAIKQFKKMFRARGRIFDQDTETGDVTISPKTVYSPKPMNYWIMHV